MRFEIHGKSLLLGLTFGAATVAGIGAMQTEPPEIGRFQIDATSTDNTAYAYVVDTATGQVWGGRTTGRSDPGFSDPKLGAAP